MRGRHANTLEVDMKALIGQVSWVLPILFVRLAALLAHAWLAIFS